MAVNLSPYGGVGAQFFDNAGNVLTGGKIETYAAGTTTPQATYTSSLGVTFHPNPIILDASGRVPSGGEIWLTDGLLYKFVLKDSNDVLIATYDNISGINSNFVNFVNQQEIQTATAGQTVFNLTTTNYTPGTNSLSVFVDGVNQYGPGAQYAYFETNSTTVTFVNGLHVGALVKFTTSQLSSSGATDSSQVSYVPAGVGAVTTTVQTKLRETVSVMDFGAIGDGVTDDTVAIQNAVDAAKEVFFPPGVYVTSSPINLPNGTWLTGVGGFQNTSTDRISRVIYTGTSGWAFQFVSPANLTNFYGDFAVRGLMISATSISGVNGGGCLLFGNTDTANFNTYGFIGRVNIENCYLSGNADCVGVYFVKVFDSTICNSQLAGHNYGVWLFGSDINKISQNRFLVNEVDVRATLSGSFSGSLKVEHNDMLVAKKVSIWLEGSIAPQIVDNYIELTSATAIETPQTGTLTVNPYSSIVIGSGTTFLTQLGSSVVGDSTRRVVIKVGDEYRQVIGISNNTTLTLDTPFHSNSGSNAWSICTGVGIIASGVSALVTLDNRIDVTSATGGVPRTYVTGSTGSISDVCLSNPLQGPLAIASSSPGTNLEVTGGYKLLTKPNTVQPARYDFAAKTGDGAATRQLLDYVRAKFSKYPSLIFNYINWFTQGGNSPRLLADNADVIGSPSVSLYTNSSADNLSVLIPEEFWGNRLRITVRLEPVSVPSFIQFYNGASLGATTTNFFSWTAATPNVYNELEFCTRNPSLFDSTNKYLTITKNTTIVNYDAVLIEVLDPNDFIFGTGSPESTYTAPVGSMYRRTDGGTNTTLYVKESGTGNTGWVAK